MEKLKMYTGKPELLLESDGWERMGSWVDKKENGLEWIFFIKPQSHSQDWATYKVVANGKALRKANYWFGFNSRTDAFAFIKDISIMKENRMELYKHMIETYFEGCV